MAHTDEFATARGNMVDSQVRPNHVHDPRVIGTMRVLPREAFAPVAAQAYSDADLKLGEGRYMLKPMVTARLAQMALAPSAATQQKLHILVIGAGSGYLAALLSLAGADVVALEEEPRLNNGALAAHAPLVQAVNGPLAAGWPAAGPYDVIVIEGAVMEIPAILAAQLTPQGRVVTILADDAAPGAIGRAVIAESVPGGYTSLPVFDCAARLLPQFAPTPAFVF